MKQAKKRLSPMLSKLRRSVTRTSHSVNTLLAVVSGSNRRIRRMEMGASETVTALKRLVQQSAEPISIDAMGAAIAAGGAMAADRGKNGK